MSIREAWSKSFGPSETREQISLYIKGFCMGIADVIPGVSGGTIAFISGIYEDFIFSLSSVNTQTLKLFLQGRWREVVSTTGFKFLVILGLGILSAIFTFSHLMSYLLKTYPIPTWGFFFGLITASIFPLGLPLWRRERFVYWFIPMFFGALLAFWLVGVIPVETPKSLAFIVLCGSIGIIAMVLPGISGSYILLLLGKYEFITNSVKNAFANLDVLASFAFGAMIGIFSFARLLKFLFANYPVLVQSLMTGFLIGSLRKVYPFKDAFQLNIIPLELAQVELVTIACAALGSLLVFLLARPANALESKETP